MDFFIGLVEQYAVSGISMGAIAFLIKHSADKTKKLIIEGSEDVKHEQAVRTYRNAFREAILILGYEIRAIERDVALRGQIPTLTHRYNAVWLDVRKTMLNSVKDFTYKGKPLELYLHSTLTVWTAQRDLLLDNLIKAINGQPTEVQNLEKKLSSFKRTLCYGSENWLDKNLLHEEEEPVKKVKVVKEEEPKAEVPKVEEVVA